jgi:hypothetical protein
MELQLKQLAPYLPYCLSLMVGSLRDYRQYGSEEMVSLGGITELSTDIDCRDFKDVKPILRPLTDLTSEITHNGKTFVPLRELIDDADHLCFVDWYDGFDKYTTQIDDDWNHVISFDSSDGELQFGFDANSNSFHLTIDRQNELILGQLDLFNKLFEWHFDIFGLIEAGLAINKNTLK